MEDRKFALVNEDELEGVSGGTDMPHLECTDFVCWWCSYKKKNLTDTSHQCTYGDIKAPNRCDNCVHIGSCERSHAFMDAYYQTGE